MPRKILIAGNWKMNLNHLEAIATVQKLAFTLPDKYFDKVEVAVLPPFTDIRSVQTLVDAAARKLGGDVPGSVTKDVPIAGAHGYRALHNSRLRLAARSRLQPEVIEHLLDCFEGEAVAGLRIGEAEGAVHIAVAVDLDDADADMLLVIRAEAAVVRTACCYRGRELQRDGARLVESRRGDVGLSIGVDQGLDLAMLGAAFA